MELKVDHTSEEALEQIKNKNYKAQGLAKRLDRKFKITESIIISLPFPGCGMADQN